MVSDIAGNGFPGFLDGPANHFVAAEFYTPTGLVVDAQGDVIVADVNNNRVREISPSGEVTTLAGNGNSGVLSDGGFLYPFADGTGGPNGTAEIYQPSSVALDGLGDVFVADHERIRKIDSSGNVTTLDFFQASGLAADGQGNVFASAYNRVYVIDSTGAESTLAGNGSQGFSDGDGGALSPVELDNPTGLALDAEGDVIVADTGNNRIRRIDPFGNVTTLAGNGVAGFADGTGGPTGTAEFNSPSAVAVDSQGNIFVADEFTYRIREIDTAGNVTTFAGDGSAELSATTLAVDAAGNVYFASAFAEPYIQKIDPSGSVTPFAGNGVDGFADGLAQPDGTAQFNGPTALVTAANGNIFIADTNNSRIRKIDASGNVTTVAGNGAHGWVDGSGGATGTAEFYWPSGIALDGQGDLLIGDSQNERIRKIDPTGNVTTLAGTGASGFADGPGGLGGTAEFNYPAGLAVDSSGDILIADADNNRIRRIDGAGNVTTVAGNGTAGFVDGTGGQTGSAELSTPMGVAVDGQGNVFVADSGNNRIRKVDASSNVTTFAGNGTPGFADGTGGATGGAEFDRPFGVAFDDHGNLLVGDLNNSRVRSIDISGNVTTLAGSGTPGFANGPPAAALFVSPAGLTVNASGTVFVADEYNNCIRTIAP